MSRSQRKAITTAVADSIPMDFADFRKDKDAASVMFLALLEKYVHQCEEDLMSNPRVPSVYKSGVVSRTLFVGDDHRFGLPLALMRGWASADLLACWRVAELRLQGIAARLWLKTQERSDGGVTVSVHVRWPNGKSEEPFSLCTTDTLSRMPMERDRVILPSKAPMRSIEWSEMQTPRPRARQ